MKTLSQVSIWNPDQVPKLCCMRLAPDFPLELLQQFLDFANNIQEDGTITHHAGTFASDGFTMAQCLFPFPEIEGTRVSSDSDVKTAAENQFLTSRVKQVGPEFR
ncbi:hypothetical protein AVEN_249212-1 [Araneus ventricosus]|uniref:Uncharacterized protein n=1 Tax=Araneus ventricosus TaxID=182803 RepID=A0A4Y2MD66_ARAVE|nr:hypothetical protein AVEN_249212-1 [Araneus ventricosus]